MKGLNRAFLIGHIGHEPELKTAASGTAVLKLSLATPSSRKVGDNWVDSPDWHRLTLFGQEAEFLSRFAHKGDTLGVECVLKPGRWLDREGTVHYSLDLVVERVLLLESRGSKQENAANEPTEPEATTGTVESPF
jgi:single-strand DNA-binding protein